MRFAKKIIWLLVSCLMAISLIMASCGTTTEEEEEEVITGEEEEEEEEEKEEVVSGPEKPEYGGTINVALARDISNWANGLEFC